MKLNHYITPYTKINSEQIKDWNIWPETMKILEGNSGCKLLDTGFGSDLEFDTTSKSKIKNKQVGPYQNNKLPDSKESQQQNKILNGRKYLQIKYLIKD